MPSFDIISKVDSHELQNAIDQANREVSNRFDFQGTNAKLELSQHTITIKAPSHFQLKQVIDILHHKMAKRSLDIRSLDTTKEPEVNLHEARQTIEVKQGIDQPMAKEIAQLIKDSKLKVQPSIHGDRVRVTGKSRDDLQSVMTTVQHAKLGLAVQFDNFRD